MNPSDFTRLATIDEPYIRECLLSEPQPPDVFPPLNTTLPIKIRHKNASVLVPLLKKEGEWHLLFTRRTDNVGSHKGLVSFPGGAADPEDKGAADTALRETWEEIGLPVGETTVCGFLPNMLELTGYTVTPVVGIIPWPFEAHTSVNEVKRIFTIPLAWMADDRNYSMKFFEEKGRPELNRTVLFFDEYDGEAVWGMTAYLTIGLIHYLLKKPLYWPDVIDMVSRTKG